MKTALKILGSILGGLLLLGVIWYLYAVTVIESKQSEDGAPSTTHFIEITSGEVLAYQEIDNNASRTVLFVGGLSAWNGTWERTLHSLNATNQNYNYVALDLPPFGYSYLGENKSPRYFRPQQAERIQSFVERKGLSKVILVAHSYGAGPSAEVVLSGDASIEKFIIIDGVLNIDETKGSSSAIMNIDWLRQGLIGMLIHIKPFAKSRLQSFAHIKNNIDDELLTIYTRYFHLRGTTGKFSDWLRDYVNDPLTYKSNQSKYYRDIRIPVRILWGDQDSLTPIELTKPLLENIPDSRLFTLEGIGHMPMIEDYAKFDAALLEAIYR